MSDGDFTGREEVPLTGGRLTMGVVRVGETVRRPAGPASDFMARLLTRLAEAGFQGTPAYLGRDERGRDIVTYLPGWVPMKWQRFTDEQVRLASALLSAFHDATRGSGLASSGQVVCHNDPGPNNVVFREGRPTAFIDFDMAAAGDPLEDLGYMAWSWCISSKPSRGPVHGQAAQVRMLAEGYDLGATGCRDIPDAILQRQVRSIAFWTAFRENLNLGCASPTSPGKVDEILAWTRRELDFTREHLSIFADALG
jgi:hypothetical protein